MLFVRLCSIEDSPLDVVSVDPIRVGVVDPIVGSTGGPDGGWCSNPWRRQRHSTAAADWNFLWGWETFSPRRRTTGDSLPGRRGCLAGDERPREGTPAPVLVQNVDVSQEPVVGSDLDAIRERLVLSVAFAGRHRFTTDAQLDPEHPTTVHLEADLVLKTDRYRPRDFGIHVREI